MGSLALPIVAGSLLAGTATSAYGQHAAGKAADRAARLNARITERETEARIAQLFTQERRTEATNITRVAKSGVRLSGSPLAVLEENAYQAERQRTYLRQSGELSADFDRARGKDARRQAGFGLASSVLEGTARVGSLAIRNA